MAGMRKVLEFIAALEAEYEAARDQAKGKVDRLVLTAKLLTLSELRLKVLEELRDE